MRSGEMSADASGDVPSSTKRSLCRFFRSPGGCRKGSKCRFSHDTAGGDEDKAPGDSELDGGAGSAAVKGVGRQIQTRAERCGNDFSEATATGTSTRPPPCVFGSSCTIPGCRMDHKAAVNPTAGSRGGRPEAATGEGSADGRRRGQQRPTSGAKAGKTSRPKKADHEASPSDLRSHPNNAGTTMDHPPADKQQQKGKSNEKGKARPSSTKRCRNGRACDVPDCRFDHGDRGYVEEKVDHDTDSAAQPKQSDAVLPPITDKSTKLCRYGPKCKRKNCKFRHLRGWDAVEKRWSGEETSTEQMLPPKQGVDGAESDPPPKPPASPQAVAPPTQSTDHRSEPPLPPHPPKAARIPKEGNETRPPIASSVDAKRQQRRQKNCRYGARCRNKRCSYQHPPPVPQDEPPRTAPAADVVNSSEPSPLVGASTASCAEDSARSVGADSDLTADALLAEIGAVITGAAASSSTASLRTRGAATSADTEGTSRNVAAAVAPFLAGTGVAEMGTNETPAAKRPPPPPIVAHPSPPATANDDDVEEVGQSVAGEGPAAKKSLERDDSGVQVVEDTRRCSADAAKGQGTEGEGKGEGEKVEKAPECTDAEPATANDEPIIELFEDEKKVPLQEEAPASDRHPQEDVGLLDALYAMGYSSHQVNAALSAFPVHDRASVEAVVAWIDENGEMIEEGGGSDDNECLEDLATDDKRPTTRTPSNSTQQDDSGQSAKDEVFAALLEMGFRIDQVEAASRAYGGVDLPSLQVMVAWIAEHCDASDDGPPQVEFSHGSESLSSEDDVDEGIDEVGPHLSSSPAEAFDEPVSIEKPAVPSAEDHREETKKEHLYRSLSSKGFSLDQIDAAVKAFGGTDRSRVDAVEAWIMEYGGGLKKESHTDQGDKEHGQPITEDAECNEDDTEEDLLRQDAEKDRRARFWEVERDLDSRYIQMMVDWCIAEFARQKSDHDAEDLRCDAEAVEIIRKQIEGVAYETLFEERVHRSIEVVEPGNQHLNGRTGVVLEWVGGRGKYKVALDTKRAKASETAFVKPDNLEPMRTTKEAEEKGKGKKKKSKKKKKAAAGQVSDRSYTVNFTQLHRGLDFSASIPASDIEKMVASRNARCLDNIMKERKKKFQARREKRDAKKREEEERIRREEEAEEREREEQQRRWEEHERQRREREDDHRRWRDVNARMWREREEEENEFRREPRVYVHFGHGGYGFFFGSRRGGPFGGGLFGDFFDEGDSDDEYEDYEDDESNSEEKFEDACAVLGVTEEASAQEIKSAFRKKALRFHPDKYSGPESAEGMSKEEAEDHFKKLSNANEYLMSNLERISA